MIKLILLATTLICMSPLRAVPIGGDKDENGYYHVGDFDYIECHPLAKEGTKIKAKASFFKGGYIERTYSINIFYSDINISENVINKKTTECEISFDLVFAPTYERAAKVLFNIYSTNALKPIVKREIEISGPTHERYFNTTHGSIFESQPTVRYYEHKDGYYSDKETIHLKGVEETYVLEDDNRIDFSKFRLKYSTLYSNDAHFSFGEVILPLTNYNNLFSNIGSLSLDKSLTNISLTLKYDDIADEYYIAFKDKQYVDPINRIMYSEYKDGLLETTSLYLPKGYESQYSMWKFGIVIYDVGENQLILSIKCNFSNGTKLMGGCGNSQYCIKTNSADPDFNIGTVVEH
ncbi:MAG: hypothetical protein MJ221_03665 [Bacilli bacterium]|nr:hypothetical protein [Bacilli bacterium]